MKGLYIDCATLSQTLSETGGLHVLVMWRSSTSFSVKWIASMKVLICELFDSILAQTQETCIFTEVLNQVIFVRKENFFIFTIIIRNEME